MGNHHELFHYLTFNQSNIRLFRSRHPAETKNGGLKPTLLYLRSSRKFYSFKVNFVIQNSNGIIRIVTCLRNKEIIAEISEGHNFTKKNRMNFLETICKNLAA